jgi:hypothetical protein
MSWLELERSVADVEADASLQRAWQLVFVLLGSPSCLAFSYISAICSLGMGNLSSPAALEPFHGAVGAFVPAGEDLLGDHHSRGFTGEQAPSQVGASKAPAPTLKQKLIRDSR